MIRKIEEFLLARSLRERILVAILAFVGGFGGVFVATSKSAEESLNQAQARTQIMHQELLGLQNQKQISPLSNQDLKGKIAELERLISAQNQQKEMLQGEFKNFFVLRGLGEGLESFFITHQKGGIAVSGSGDFASVFGFFRQLENLQTLQVESLSVYPLQRKLEFFVGLKIMQEGAL